MLKYIRKNFRRYKYLLKINNIKSEREGREERKLHVEFQKNE